MNRVDTKFGAAIVLVATLVAAPAFGQGVQPAAAPVAEISASEMVRALMGSLPRYNYTPTAKPQAGTGLCSGQNVAGAPRLAVEAPPPANETVPAVPYPTSSAPSVQMDVQFGKGSDVVLPGSQRLLLTLATALKDPLLANARFAVAGHADATGDLKRNEELSCARAIAVRKFLINEQGVSPSRVTAYGFGHLQPLQGHPATSEINRRVEVRRGN